MYEAINFFYKLVEAQENLFFIVTLFFSIKYILKNILCTLNVTVASYILIFN